MLHRFKFRTQLTFCFCVVIVFITAATFFMLHIVLRDSYRDQGSRALENYCNQLVVNINGCLDYYVSYLRLVSTDAGLLRLMEREDLPSIQAYLFRDTREFVNMNQGAISAIRVYRSNVYTHIAGLGASQDVLRALQKNDRRYSSNVLITGTYLNDRNEKVFSIFQEVYQTNPEREYFLEICLYETELLRYFNKETREKIYLFYGDALSSMSERSAFSSMLHSKADQGGGTIDRAEVEIAETTVAITDKDEHELSVLIKTDVSHLEEGYVDLLWRMLPFFLAMFILAFFFSTLLTNQMNYRLKILQEKIAAMSDWKLSQPLHIKGRDEFSVLADNLEETRKRILALIEQNSSAQQRMRVAEMSALRAQINSHFLFNSLSSIKWLAREKDEKTLSEAVDSLALFLRYSLAIKENQVLLEDEVTQLRAYIYLQHLRYGEDINVCIDIEEELLQCKTVRLVLQPLVENAIYHGRKNNGAKLNITIYTNKGVDFYELIVEDDGNGITQERLQEIRNGEKNISKSGYGLCNVIERVAMCLGEKGSVSVQSIPNAYTIVSIRQPL